MFVCLSMSQRMDTARSFSRKHFRHSFQLCLGAVFRGHTWPVYLGRSGRADYRAFGLEQRNTGEWARCCIRSTCRVSSQGCSVQEESGWRSIQVGRTMADTERLLNAKSLNMLLFLIFITRARCHENVQNQEDQQPNHCYPYGDQKSHLFKKYK